VDRFREASAMAARSKKPENSAMPISDRTLTSLTQVFGLMSDASRLRILLTLARQGESHVSALCQMLNQSQPAVSHHLTLLRMAGLVGFRRAGKFNYYRMDSLTLGELLERVFGEAGRASAIKLGDFSLSFTRNAGKRR
jgi:ArsR family transcriptional regulator, arsenate/arsenite/antimonite-responsive transcriptional repressor